MAHLGPPRVGVSPGAGCQYLVTANHVLPAEDRVSIELTAGGEVRSLTLERCAGAPPDADVAVLSLPEPITPMLPVVPSLDGIVYSQGVYFLGYVFGLALEVAGADRLAFVKKAILSATTRTATGVHLLYLDGLNNPGFSGGPVVFHHQQTGAAHIAGVISAW